MSSRRRSNRSRKCPGCNTAENDHGFGPMSRICDGPPSDDDHTAAPRPSPNPAASNSEVLQAIRTLASQIQALQVDQNDLRALVQPSTSQHNIGGGTLQGKCYTLPYVDLLTLLPFSESSPSDGTAKDNNKRQQATMESFDHWLEAWTLYERDIIKTDPSHFGDVSQYRSLIQQANRKFRWATVYDFDVRFRQGLSTTPGRLSIIDTTLYATILDSSAVRKESTTCPRCKSSRHLIRDCPFRPRPAMEENKKDNATKEWKYDKWMHNGIEGCNLYQRRACQQGKECKRAHVCKSCRGNHSLADCSVSPKP